MATLSLLQTFGFDASGSLQPGSHLAKAFPQFLHLQNVPLNQVPLAEGKIALNFVDPIPVALPNFALSVGAGFSGRIRLVSSTQHVLESDDPFSDIPVHEREIYLGLGLKLSVPVGTTVSSGSLAFGVNVEHDFEVVVYYRFFRADNDAFPSFGEALKALLSRFAIPQSLADLESLDRDTVILVDGTGELDLSVSFGISTPVRQLAALSPVAGDVFALNTSSGFTAGVGVKLIGGYVSRLRRLETDALELWFAKTRSRVLSAELSATAGVTGQIGSFDLVAKFISALSLNPVVDVAELKAALPGEDPAKCEAMIQNFQDSLGAAISTALSVGVTAGFSSLETGQSILAFELDPALANSSASAPAALAAMNGDFRAFTEKPSPPGVKQTANVFVTTQLAQQKISVNLLGLVNFFSLGKLARISEVHHNPEGGITLVTDTADANRLEALLLNTAGKPTRLRAMLSEDFLFQATFKALDFKVLPPDFVARHTFFDINNSTAADQMKNLLDVCRTLRLLSAEEEAARLKGHSHFGRTTFWLQTKYSTSAIAQIFLSADGAARDIPGFERLGRQALGQLLMGSDGQEFRKLVADLGPQGDAIWQALHSCGNARNFNSVFQVPLDQIDPRVNAAGADYLCISNWAEAMKKLADTIVEVRRLLSHIVHFSDPELDALRAQLRHHMAEVVKHSGDHFGEPLGLVTVFLASARSGSARVIATGPSIPTLANSINSGDVPSHAEA